MLWRYNYRAQSEESFAFPGRESRNLLHRLEGGATLGLGAGAFSLFDGFSYRNTEDVERYIQYSRDAEMICEQMGPVEERAALLYTGLLQLERGAYPAPAAFRKGFQKAIGELLSQAYLTETEGMLKKTEKAIADPIGFRKAFVED